MPNGRRPRRLMHRHAMHGSLRRVSAGSLGGDTSDALGGAPVITFPGVALQFRVMIAPDANPDGDPEGWIYTDITRFVLYENKIIIRRGDEPGQKRGTPSECNLTLKNYLIDTEVAPYNVAGIFSPRNPRSPFYGKLTRNIPIKVDVNAGTGWVRRFTGFVAKWPPKSEVSGKFRYVNITASGRRRRVERYNPLVRSYVRRSFAAVNEAGGTDVTTAYWSLEDGAHATQAVADQAGYAPMVVTGDVQFAQANVSDAPGIAAAPDLTGGGSLRGPVTGATSTTQWGIGFYFKATGDARLIEFSTTGSLYVWAIAITATTVTLASNLGVACSGAATPENGEWQQVYINLVQSGNNVIPSMSVGDAFSVTGATILGATIGKPLDVIVNPFGDTDIQTISHLYANQNIFVLFSLTSLEGAPGITTANNINFAAAGVGITVKMPTNIARSGPPGPFQTGDGYFVAENMGPSGRGNFMDVFQESVDADEGWITERFDSHFQFDRRMMRENQATAMTLDQGQYQIFRLDPEDDDLLTVNQYTMSRTEGSEFTAYQDSGPLGRDVVGVVADGASKNLYTDQKAFDHAWYQVMKGTVDEARFPRMQVHLSRPECAGLIATWLTVDVGDRIKTLGPFPADMAPQDMDQMMLGYTEFLDQFEWLLELNTVPYWPYRTFELAETSGDDWEFSGFLMTDLCVLAEDVDTTETDIDVTTSDTLWSTLDDDWWRPVPVNMGGEIVLVTKVTGSANPQTLTVIRGAWHSPAITHAAGQKVEVYLPGVLALQDEVTG